MSTSKQIHRFLHSLSLFGAASISSLGLAGWLTVPYYSYTHLAFYSNVFLRVVVTKRKIEDTTQIKLDLSEHNMSEERIHSAQTNICEPKRRFLLVFRRPNSLCWCFTAMSRRHECRKKLQVVCKHRTNEQRRRQRQRLNLVREHICFVWRKKRESILSLCTTQLEDSIRLCLKNI